MKLRLASVQWVNTDGRWCRVVVCIITLVKLPIERSLQRGLPVGCRANGRIQGIDVSTPPHSPAASQRGSSGIKAKKAVKIV